MKPVSVRASPSLNPLKARFTSSWVWPCTSMKAQPFSTGMRALPSLKLKGVPWGLGMTRSPLGSMNP